MIWSLNDDDDNCIKDDFALKELGMKHFSHIFQDD